MKSRNHRSARGHYTRSSAKQFHRFPSLPTELRCHIGKIATGDAVSDSPRISLNSANGSSTASTLHQAGILTASRESQYEAESAFYKSAVFTFNAGTPPASIRNLREKLDRVPTRILRHMSALTIRDEWASYALPCVLGFLEDNEMAVHVEMVANVSSFNQAKDALKRGTIIKDSMQPSRSRLSWYVHYDSSEVHTQSGWQPAWAEMFQMGMTTISQMPGGCVICTLGFDPRQVEQLWTCDHGREVGS
ncbi:hypothetical protein H2199_001331 [Coniosporium tulheliwenetii]|uniref:Uncharacterized protein n=1 Tax=Coniosporium tulheliwenetii TaxID=3383036 RepID=A0ACC2ZLX4_9PEZI|nr:hypothetical protein H2199_001331 [Cladosporium sp. JES 115]